MTILSLMANSTISKHQNNTQIEVIYILKKYVDDHLGYKECLAIICLVLLQMFGIRLFYIPIAINNITCQMDRHGGNPDDTTVKWYIGTMFECFRTHIFNTRGGVCK